MKLLKTNQNAGVALGSIRVSRVRNDLETGVQNPDLEARLLFEVKLAFSVGQDFFYGMLNNSKSIAGQVAGTIAYEN
jgi:hypothetical protein